MRPPFCLDLFRSPYQGLDSIATDEVYFTFSLPYRMRSRAMFLIQSILHNKSGIAPVLASIKRLKIIMSCTDTGGIHVWMDYQKGWGHEPK